jgi:hypothetical protein
MVKTLVVRTFGIDVPDTEAAKELRWKIGRLFPWCFTETAPVCFLYDPYDTAKPCSMWGGFACTVLLPQTRVGDLVIQESQRGLHEAVKRDSRHRFDGKGLLKRRLLRVLEKITGSV